MFQQYVFIFLKSINFKQYFMHLYKAQFQFTPINQFCQYSIFIHHLHNFYYCFPIQLYLEIILCFRTSCNYYNLCLNLNNNFGVFIFVNFEIPNADFQNCKHYNIAAIDTWSS